MASIYDQLTFNTLRNNQNLGNNRNTNYNQSLTDWGSPMGGVPDEPMMPPMLDQTGQMGASNYRGPQGVFPESENLIPPFMEEPSGVGEGYDKGRFRDVIGDKISGFTTPIMGAMRKMVEPNTPEENFGLEYFKNMRNPSTGRVWEEWAPSNVFGGGNIATGFGEGMGARGQKRIDKISATLAKWEEDKEKYKSQLDRTMLYDRRNKFQKQLDAYNQDLAAATGGADIPTGPTDTGATTSGGDYQRAPIHSAREAASRGVDVRATGMMGPGGRHYAYGGRAGYQGGELVEDESMMEATPTGMMEENIEEVQGEPTREQLEAIALEIFRLPLEQLNEQQLEVVYQAAMEQEPSEEEVQFAAQEGPGEGIASLV